MELTSGGLISLLILVATSALGATVWLWPRLGGLGKRTVLSRAGLLVGSQVTLAVVLVVWANSYFFWYGSWDDLFGVQSKLPKGAHITRGQYRGGFPSLPAASLTGSVSAQVPAGNLVNRVALGLWSKERAKKPATYGLLQDIRIAGARTGYVQQAYVLLPPEYFQPRFAQRRFPVVLMLAGYPGTTKSLVVRLKLPEWVDKGRAAHEVQPTIYVMMQPTVVPPRDTECTDVPAGPQVASYFAQDVPEALAAMYRTAETRAGWGIMGDSTGGYCAAKIAMTYSDRYGSAVNLGGHFHALKDTTTGDLWGGSQVIRDQNDLIWRLQHLPMPPINLLITSSKIGEKSYPQAVQFLSLARSPLTTDQIILESGGHNFETWGRVFPSVLKWMSQHQQVQ